MKKTMTTLLGIMLVVTLLMATGCTKMTTVEFTVDGFDAMAIVPAEIQSTHNCQAVQESADAQFLFSITFKTDGDHSLTLVDRNHQTCNIMLKVHNGQVEVVSPDGVTLNIVVK